MAIVLASALAGCGGEDDYENEPRPAAPINVTAAITDEEISMSPREFGAGPVVIIVSNQTDSKQTITLETEELGGSTGGIKESTRPIAPGGTGTLKADVREGSYALGADGGLEPVMVEVGPARASAQDELLQP